nr:MAG TPA: hypothetical protein [Caudoviricetes sp.]
MWQRSQWAFAFLIYLPSQYRVFACSLTASLLFHIHLDFSQLHRLS